MKTIKKAFKHFFFSISKLNRMMILPNDLISHLSFLFIFYTTFFLLQLPINKIFEIFPNGDDFFFCNFACFDFVISYLSEIFQFYRHFCDTKSFSLANSITIFFIIEFAKSFNRIHWHNRETILTFFFILLLSHKNSPILTFPQFQYRFLHFQ